MLKNRIIPILLLKQGRCVKGRQFRDYRDTGAPVTAAKIYDAQRVDELVFLDILASREEREVLLDIVSRTADECFMPLGVGGGIKTIDDIKTVLSSGADKVIINSAALENPVFVRDAARYFGRANIVVAIDYKKTEFFAQEVFTHGGTRAAGRDAFGWAQEVASLGAGEVILTCIDKEGTMEGYDISFVRSVVDALSIPVVIHGGCGTLAHLAEGIQDAHASGVAAASIFHFTDQNPIKARYYLAVNNLNVRK